MSQEIEIEFKNLLTKEEFNLIKTALDFPQAGGLQTNHYFETADFQLKAHGSALRIRKKKDNYVLTLKEPHAEGLLETHDTLSEREATSWLNGAIIPKENIQKQLDKLNIPAEKLTYCGELTTVRHTISFENTLLVLDYSQYNDQADYELELEAGSYAHGEAVFKNVLKNFNIPQRKTPNKIERFFASIRG